VKTIKIQISDIWNKRAEPKNHSPIFNYCRKLIKNGELPETRLEVYRGDILCIATEIVEGAKLAVKEDEKKGPMFDKHRAKPVFLFK
jgi:hypothetical protein